MGEKVDVPNWLTKLPLAPTYYPTDTEFADPIAYISKIEKEASEFGICKVVPPLPKPSKKYVFTNLNKSLLKSPELDSSQLNHKKPANGDPRAVFTTRHQELGCSGGKKSKPHPPSLSHKQVWQSGEVYTLDQFESKAKTFARAHLGMIRDVTPLIVEALFWKAASQKPIYIEYANDVPGSAFSVPDQVCHYFHRRRRRRSDISPRKYESHVSGTSGFDTNTLGFLNSGSDSPSVTNGEGTAGWKLSNSPWNLQVISRSPGSLTRFMLNDIPGVTSPMVYIGMLFSWFAWHVEDHELHSLNFLHTGSPKTWYAVPGDYAFQFEEVIRSKGYGEDLDRLDALTLLGEKTNLLSPDVVIASGIPCCRLVQNPGEFVVTFPRAYHIGFSHGFNCGEAANFGTPQWLKVAKSAAVRRAAMNYLPMLSHQQLLYMLTMSFVARIPRDLLRGGRTSRLKDRQKEERELLVKKAFIDDILNETNLFSVLHGKEATLYAVLWDPEALPSPASVSHDVSTMSSMPVEDNQNNEGCSNQFDSTGLSMETFEDFYVDDNDLPCGLRVDSGILACVACGVLGFPFMTIVQPSQQASEELFPTDCQVTGMKDVSRAIESRAPLDLYNVVVKSSSGVPYNDENQKVYSTCRRKLGSMENCLQKSGADAVTTNSVATETVKQDTIWNRYASSVQLNCSMIPFGGGHPINSKCQSLQSRKDSQRKWNTSNRFFRPRVFCLEHAIEIEKLLHSKGGANVLIICHSAYPKIKAQAMVIAEEISTSFDSDEVPLQLASKEDTDLISISISNDEHEASGEDWTTRLGLNLPYCVKHRKLCPSKHEKHALALRGLYSDIFIGSDKLSLKWNSRRCRTPYRIVGPRRSKSSGSTEVEKSCVLVEKTVKRNDGESKIKQYSRRSCNRKVVSPWQACSEHNDYFRKYQPEDVHANNEALDNNINKDALCNSEKNEIFDPPRLAGLCSINTENDVSKLAKPSIAKNTAERESCSIGKTIGIAEISDIVNCSGVLALENNIENDCHEVGGISNAITHNLCMAEETRQPRALSDCEIRVGSFTIPSSRDAIQGSPLESQNVDTVNEGEKVCNLLTADCSKMRQMIIPADETSEMSDISDPIKSPSSQPNVITFSQNETKTPLENESQNKGCNSEMQDILQVQAENQTTDTEVGVFNHASLLTRSSLLSSTLGSTREQEFPALEEADKDHEVCSSVDDTMVLEDNHSSMFDPQPTKKERSKRRRELDQLGEDENRYNSFIKSPCEGLRPRTSREATCGSSDVRTKVEIASKIKKQRSPNGSVSCTKNKRKVEEIYKCDIEGCRMSFKTRDRLNMHKLNRCTYKGCGKQFNSHRYAILHQRVHVDERPLKCPWKGCAMSFKWAWARTEHLRVHTGERPYQCKFEGCGLTFRFVSDFSRHRRKNGHNIDS